MNNIENQKNYFIYNATYKDYETISGEEVKKRFGANKIVSVGIFSRPEYNENLRLGLRSDDNVVYLISAKILSRDRLDALERNEVCSRETYDIVSMNNNNNANLGGRRKSRRTHRKSKRSKRTRRHRK